MNSVFSIIICFYPDVAKLARLIDSIEPSVDKILLFNNGGLEDSELIPKSKKVKFESRGKNVGLATALNIGCKMAFENNFKFIIAFDQDSNPEKSMIPILQEEILKGQDKDERVAAIGPQLIDERDGAKVVAPFIQFNRFGFVKWSGGGVQPVSQLITSGCLIDLSVWSKNNKFDDRLFIDLVDNNWCWRVIRNGYIILGTTKTKMPHEISDGIKTTRHFSVNTYGPTRRYFQARNSIYHLFHEPLSLAQKAYVMRFIAVTFISSITSDDHPLRSVWECFRGVAHGVVKKLGPYRE